MHSKVVSEETSITNAGQLIVGIYLNFQIKIATMYHLTILKSPHTSYNYFPTHSLCGINRASHSWKHAVGTIKYSTHALLLLMQENLINTLAFVHLQ